MNGLVTEHGPDLYSGRKMLGLLTALGAREIAVDYVVVDTLRVARPTFAAIFAAWRDGYADTVAANTPMSREEFVATFDDLIATILDPTGYGVWFVPVWTALVP